VALQRLCVVVSIFLLMGGSIAVAGSARPEGGCGASGSAVICVAGDDPAPTPGKQTAAPVQRPVCVAVLDRTDEWPSREENGEYYYQKKWKCAGEVDWRYTWVCASCDPATPPQPPPPSPEAVWNLLVAIAKQPVGRFAPPVERGNGIAMVYGKRLYFRADTSSFAVQRDTMTFPGGWSATGVLTPVGINFTAAGNGTVRCAGPGFDGTSRAGRAAADAAGCYLPITQGPKAGTIVSTLTIRWNITVESNIPGVALQGVTTTTQTIALPVRDVQSVVSG
jgi:hypothetical protein